MNAVIGKPGRRKAFTIIELLVVISLLVMLLGLVVPAVQLARERSRRSKCLDNLRTIGMALQAFENTNGELPIGNDSTNGLSWRVYLLPFLEQQELFGKFDLGPGPFCGGADQEGPNKSVWATTRMDGYLCPSATRHLATDGSSKLLDPLRDTYNAQYYGVAGPLGTSPGSGQAYSHVDSGVYGGWARSGLLFMDSRVRSGDVRDGLTNTLMVGELAVANVSAWTSGWHGGGDGGNWVRGAGVEVFPLTGTGATKNVKYGINITPLLTKDINNCSFSSLHEGRGANFVRGDGGTVFLSDDIALTTYKSLCSRNGREAGASMTD